MVLPPTSTRLRRQQLKAVQDTQSSLLVKYLRISKYASQFSLGQHSSCFFVIITSTISILVFSILAITVFRLQTCVILITVTMRYAKTSLLLLTYLLAFTSAGLNDIGGMFPPRDLIGDIGAKAVESLLSRASTQIVVSCEVDYSLSSSLVTPPDMIRSVGVRITGLPEADNHVNAFKKEIEDACFADNLKEYTPFTNLANTEVSVTMKIKAIIDFRSEGARKTPSRSLRA